LVGWECLSLSSSSLALASKAGLRLSVVALSVNGMLLFVVLMSCVGVGIGAGGCIVIVIVIDDCCCSFCNSSVIRQRDCMLWMIWQLIALKSTIVHFVIVVAVVVEGRLQHDVVLGSGGGVVIRGSVIIVVGADQSAARICLIARCQKGKFSTSAAIVR